MLVAQVAKEKEKKKIVERWHFEVPWVLHRKT